MLMGAQSNTHIKVEIEEGMSVNVKWGGGKIIRWFASSTCAYFCPKSQVKRDMSSLGKGRTYSIACLRCIQCHNIACAEDLPRILPLSKFQSIGSCAKKWQNKRRK